MLKYEPILPQGVHRGKMQYFMYHLGLYSFYLHSDDGTAVLQQRQMQICQ